MAKRRTPEYEYVRALVEKDWGAPERIQLVQAAAEFARIGAAGSLAIADQLRAYAELAAPGDPPDQVREADRRCHERVAKLLARASRGLRRR